MGEKEDNVYKAKLAEQAERYDGMIFSTMLLSGGNLERHVAMTVGDASYIRLMLFAGRSGK